MSRESTTMIIADHEVERLGPPDQDSFEMAGQTRHVFIVGSKGIPAMYGGFETFVEKLTQYRQDERIIYHVSRMAEDELRYKYNGAFCFDINVPNIGAARAVYCDIQALCKCIEYCHMHPEITNPVFYVLACRIGPFIPSFRKRIHELGGKLYINPDGHEWKRAKWSVPVRHYWKLSESLMIRNADLVICDSKNIRKYICDTYSKYKPGTRYISYGSEIEASPLDSDEEVFRNWLEEKKLRRGQYYLVVGRFVPENNFETMIREFMAADTDKDLALITTTDGRFYNQLSEKLHFSRDSRIKFLGTVYDQALLKKIREEAYAYIHGHEVGGTNPSLLEALGSTKLNLLLNVGFNREVAQKAALYWTKEEGSLASLITKAEKLTGQEIGKMGERARERIRKAYSWPYIVSQYEALFLENSSRKPTKEERINGRDSEGES